MTTPDETALQAWNDWVGKRSDLLATRHNENIFMAGYEAALAQQGEQPVAWACWFDFEDPEKNKPTIVQYEPVAYSQRRPLTYAGVAPTVQPPRFPTMLRKMWSGGEVQQWLDENWPASATPAAPQEDVPTLPRYCYSTDEERYHGPCDTREEAIAELAGRGGWVAQERHPLEFISARSLGDDICQRISEILGEEVGEVAECFALSAEQEQALGALVLAWINDNPGFGCYGVKDIEHIEAA